jgi:polar amino acid transport system substrate-binding protein
MSWVILALGLACGGSWAKAMPTVTLTATEWPPYTGRALPDQGATSAVVRAAFAAMGYQLKIEFYPWARAVLLADTHAGYAGVFPEYYSDVRKRQFILSPPIGHGPLGLAQRRAHPVKWGTLDDLSHWTIGVVQGYVNTTEFDRRVARKQQRVDVSSSDTLNLNKLAIGRVDLAIVDPYVFDYLAEHDPLVAAAARQLEINPHLLENKDLYIAFKRSPEGERWARLFAAGLKKIDVAGIMRRYIRNYR